ncbi:MAG: hypothetical protein H0T56_11815, partial [Pseudaminobacter sp.]|nr:hypothetical protein [Pseudaminobacter sp.]
MNWGRTGPCTMLAALSLAAALISVVMPARAESVAVSALKEQTHIHGLAVDRQNPDQLLIATHHGLFRS